MIEFMNRKIILSIAFALCLVSVSFGQTRLIGERSVYTQYFLTPYLLHPGATGQNEYGEVIANYRNAWASFPGAPKTVTFGYQGPIGNRIGLGLIGVSDSYAAFATTKGGLSLSYTVESPKNKIGFGIAGEYIQHKLRSDELINVLVNTTDPEIVNRLNGASYFDASFGIYGIYNEKLIYGLTVPSILSQRLNDGPDKTEKEIGYIVSLGYRYDIPEKDVTIEPSVYVKKLMLVPTHVDFNLKADFLNESLTTGITYSYGSEERIGFLIGTQLSNVGFHYSYNLSMNDFQQYNNGSHELSLKLRFQTYKKSE